MTETDMEGTTKIEREFYLYYINYELAFVLTGGLFKHFFLINFF